jgi:hypothetical protein
MSKDLKQLVRDNTKDLVLIDSIDRVPDCPELGQINFCFSNKRAASPYQQFIKECLLKKPLKGKPFGEAGKYMKECAIEWRSRRAKA